MLYTGSLALKQIQRFILAQRPYVLYWLKGPVLYTGSEALCFILAQRPSALYWLKGPGTQEDS